MFHRLIMIYRNDRNEDQGYTLFLDQKSGRIYKAYHRKVNQTFYWIPFFLTLVVLRELNTAHLAIKQPLLMILILVFELTVSYFIGRALYKMYYMPRLKEIYITKDMLEDYAYKGKSVLKKDVIIAIILIIVLIMFTLLYVFTFWFIWLLGSFFVAVLISFILCFFSRDRFKMCKRV